MIKISKSFLRMTLIISVLSPFLIQGAATPQPTRTKNLFFMKNEEEKAQTPATSTLPAQIPANNSSANQIAIPSASKISNPTAPASTIISESTTPSVDTAVPVTTSQAISTPSNLENPNIPSTPSMPEVETATPTSITTEPSIEIASPTQVAETTSTTTPEMENGTATSTPAVQTVEIPLLPTEPTITSDTMQSEKTEDTAIKAMTTPSENAESTPEEESSSDSDEQEQTDDIETEQEVTEDESPTSTNEISTENPLTQREVIVINNAGCLITLYGVSENGEEREIANNLGPLAQVVLSSDVKQVYVKEERGDHMCHHVTVDYENISDNFPAHDGNLIETEDVYTILTVERRMNLDGNESKLVLESTTPQMPYGALIYNTTSSEQTLKATFPHEATWFSTPKVYYKIPPMSAHMITFPLMNKDGIHSTVNLGLVSSKMPLIINPSTEENSQQKICCIFTLDEGDVLTDVTEQFE